MVNGSFIDRIFEKETCLHKLAEEILQRKCPLILYGAGFWAKQQFQALLEQGVRFSAIAVDEQYLPVSDFMGIPVISIDEALRKYPKADVWLGFNLDKQSFNAVSQRLRNSIKFELGEIYGCDCAQYGRFAEHNYSYELVKENAGAFDWLYQRLGDDKSKEAMLSYFNQRISGDYKYCEIGYDQDHYFAKEILTPQKNDVFVDCGAFTGDTIEELLKIKKPKMIFAFEPEQKNYQILCEKFSDDGSIVCINKGAYNKESVLRFSSGAADASKISDEGDVEILTTTIDSLQPSATFIKMDIEGAELSALQGAENTIKKCHPKLAISVYHKFDDLLEIPQYINSLDSSYKFYLRRHSHLVHELVLYAI